MLREMLEYLIAEGKVDQFSIDGREYTSRPLAPVKPPMPMPITFNTLTGFAAFAAEYNKEDVFVHVASPSHVSLMSCSLDEFEQRDIDATATMALHGEQFKFGQGLDPEEFIIGLRSLFVDTPHRAEILKLAGNLRAESSIEVEDDGVTQSVGQKAGVVLKSRATLPPQVMLAPWRTFREAEQPTSEFIVRAKQDREGSMPRISLFEADGGAWKLKAIQNVAKFLSAALPGFKVLA